MSGIFDLITQQLGSGGLADLGKRLGTDEKQTKSAVQTALPLLLGALAKNSQKDDGAKALHRAVERDHDGSALDNLGALFSGAGGGAGEGILKHVLGSRRPAVEQAVSRTAGMDKSQAGNLLGLLAPMVMGAVGKKSREQGLGAGALASLLQGERQEIEKKAPQSGGLLTSLLDQDGDGDLDLGDAMGALGKFFR